MVIDNFVQFKNNSQTKIKKVRISIKYIICLICLLFVSDLVYGQQRRKKRVRQKPDRESTTFRNAYQDLTARYNGYFNANLILDQSILQLEQNHKDDFSEILASDKVEAGEKASSVHAQMDIVIKKASVDIKLHPNSKWVDDCYLLIGQAHYLKGDYDEALENLGYIQNRFENDIRIEEFQKRDNAGSGRKRSGPKVDNVIRGGVKVGNKSVGTEDAKKLLKKKREEQKAKKEAERKQREKDREQEKKRKEKERKELEKEREEKNKEIAKDRKESKKEKEKEIKEREKEREKERKRKLKEKERVKKMDPKERKEYYQKEKERKAREAAEKEAEQEREAREKAKEEAEKLAAEKEAEQQKAESEVEEEIVEAEEEVEETIEKEEEKKEEKKEPKPKKETASKKSSKKKRNKKRSSIGHKLAYHEALVWTAKTYLAQESPDKAKAVLDLAEGNRKFPKKLKPDLHATYADYYLSLDDKNQAYESLDEAISWTKGRKNKARLHFMQAQISGENQDYAAAGDSYKKVTKSRAEYPLKFNANLNLAKSRLLAGEYSPEQAKRYLEKMLKDGNNIDTKDQIYMAMAEIDIANGDMESAFALLDEAAKNSTVNKEQKALVFLRIADLYFDKEEFLLASAYYDSTATYLPKSYPNYDDIASRKDVLSELATHLQTIQVEDSLQRIALLPEGKRNVFLDELIEDLIAQAEERKLADEASKNVAAAVETSNVGAWYFYNSIEKSRGYNLFQVQWNNRPLQDNWRRQTGLVGFDTDEETPVASSSTAGTDTYIDLAESGTLNRSILLANLPLTAAMMKQSHEKIMYAYFQSGKVYKDKLQNIDKAILSFDELLRRYPQCDYALQTHYTLYLLEKEKNNMPKAEIHKNYVLANDKKGIYKKLIENPDLESELAGQNKELMKYYEKTYGMYLDGDFDEVLNRAKQANEKFTPNDMEPQFDLLTAFVTGHTAAKDQYVTALQGIVSKYPADPVKDKAIEILNVISGNSANKPKKAPTSNSIFKEDMEATHYFVISFNGFVNQINQTINGFSDYNTVNNSLDKLTVTQMLLNPENQILLVKTFKSGSKAMDYYNKVIQQESQLLGKIEGVDYKIFAISKKNFTQFFKSKDAEAYEEFFKETYF